jgi:hypothetical protein
MNLISILADFPILESMPEMGIQQPVSVTESSRLESSDGEATGFPLASTLRQDVQNAPSPERSDCLSCCELVAFVSPVAPTSRPNIAAT